MLDIIKIVFDFIAAGIGITIILGVGAMLVVFIVSFVQMIIERITS